MRPANGATPFAQPYNLTFNADSSMLYVAALGAQGVGVISLSQRKVIETIATASPVLDASPAPSVALIRRGSVVGVTRTPSGRLGFATLKDSNRLAVLNLDEFKLVKTLPLGNRPERAYATADGRYMLVPNNGDKRSIPARSMS